MSLITIIAALFLFTALRHVSAQNSSSPAESPGPSPPPDVYKILNKAGQYTVLIRLLKSTKVGDQINSQLASPNSELTFFGPSDNAFAGLKSGTLNGLSDQQKVQLLQFHIVPSFISMSNFQTVSNPVQTQASDTYQFPLNVTTAGASQVNVTTGIVNATVSGTVYSDGQLAIYQVDSVLLPLGIFAPRPDPPAPAPAQPSSAKKKKSSDDDGSSGDDGSTESAAAANGVPGFVLAGVSVSFVLVGFFL